VPDPNETNMTIEGGALVFGEAEGGELGTDIPDQGGQWQMLCELVRQGTRLNSQVDSANRRGEELLQKGDALLQLEERLSGYTDRIETAVDRLITALGGASGRAEE
jgi:hypothetical protein